MKLFLIMIMALSLFSVPAFALDVDDEDCEMDTPAFQKITQNVATLTCRVAGGQRVSVKGKTCRTISGSVYAPAMIPQVRNRTNTAVSNRRNKAK